MEKLRLVIVDDEEILLRGLVETYDWEGMGFSVVGSAQSGEQALAIIEETNPHVVLTDIRMKQMSGLDVMERVRQSSQQCLFVVLSAYRDFEYAKNAIKLGAFAYLLKPIDEEELTETFARAHLHCQELLERKEKLEIWEKLKDSFERMNVGYRMLEQQPDGDGSKNRDDMRKALIYIDAHLEEESLSVVAVAAHVYLNPVYFGRVFKQTFKMTFKQYLLQRRMELAKLLLSDGQMSISRICEQVGIGDPSYFSRLFKQYTGMLPSEFKSHARSGHSGMD